MASGQEHVSVSLSLNVWMMACFSVNPSEAVWTLRTRSDSKAYINTFNNIIVKSLWCNDVISLSHNSGGILEEHCKIDWLASATSSLRSLLMFFSLGAMFTVLNDSDQQTNRYSAFLEVDKHFYHLSTPGRCQTLHLYLCLVFGFAHTWEQMLSWSPCVLYGS